MEKEIKLNLKLDTYKELRNYLHNECEMSKEKIQSIIENMFENFLTKQLSDEDSVLSCRVGRMLKQALLHKSYCDGSVFEKILSDILKEKIMEAITPEIIIRALQNKDD